jgi:hypothetical protein
VPVAPTDDAYPLAQGPTYRVTASVSLNFTGKQVADYLTAHGWSTVSVYDQGDVVPADWPAGETLDTLEDHHRWLRGEGVHTGAPTSIDRVSTLHAIFAIHLSIYRIAGAWQLVAPAPGSQDMPPIVIGPGAGPLGLDVGIPQPIGASVYYAWADATDPSKLVALGATMRQGGYPIAADVLDQRALELQGAQQGAAVKAETGRNAAAIAAGVGSLLIAAVGALRRH